MSQKCGRVSWQLADVWGWNFDDEFDRMISIVAKAGKTSSPSKPVVLALDTEFPGFLFEGKPGVPESQYAALRENVDHLELIQIGLAVADADGTIVGGWSFNLWFDLAVQRYNKASVKFLSAAGVDFARHAKEGIDARAMGWRLHRALEGPFLQRCSWVTFAGRYDWGYMLKLVTGIQLPLYEDSFDTRIDSFFSSRKELRDFLPVGSLEVLAKLHKVQRWGASHTAGSDALTTLELFLKVTRFDFTASVVDTVVLSGEKKTVVARVGTAAAAEVGSAAEPDPGTGFVDLASSGKVCQSAAKTESFAVARSPTSAHGAPPSTHRSRHGVEGPKVQGPVAETTTPFGPDRSKGGMVAAVVHDATTGAAARAAAATARTQSQAHHGPTARSLGARFRINYLLMDVNKENCNACSSELSADELCCKVCGTSRPSGSPRDRCRQRLQMEAVEYPMTRVIHEDRCRECSHPFKRPEALLCRMCGTPRPETIEFRKARPNPRHQCRKCDYILKKPDTWLCRMCGTVRPPPVDESKFGEIPRGPPASGNAAPSPDNGEGSSSSAEPISSSHGSEEELHRDSPKKVVESSTRRRVARDIRVSRLQELAIFASILCVSEIVFAAIFRSQTGGAVG